MFRGSGPAPATRPPSGWRRSFRPTWRRRWPLTCPRTGAMARAWWRGSRPVYLGRSGGGTGPGGGSVDSIEGVLIVSGPRGGLAAETPLRAIASYYPSAVDQPMFEQAYRSRVAALAEAFAGWTPRQLGI